MTLLIVYVSLALGVSFLCSVMEAVLLSITPGFLAQLEERRPATAARVRGLKEDIDRPLAAILSLNTIAHTVGAAGAGAQAAKLFGDAWMGVISAVLTLLILILSEIIPKTLGALYWRQLASPIARLLEWIILLLWPLVILSQGLTRLLSRGTEPHKVSREELSAMVRHGAEVGAVPEEESRLLQSIFRFRSLQAKDIMTPRMVVDSLDEERTVGEVVDPERPLRFSRIPVYRDRVENIEGYVLKDTVLLKAALGEGDLRLKELIRKILVLPETLHLPPLFDRLLETQAQIALVIDEYGDFQGIVTMEDILETLLGLEIVDEADPVTDMRELARQKWQERARRMGILPEESTGKTREEAEP